MENASKALIMAGGVLIALLVIGALMMMFNNLSTYENANRQSEAEAHIADFNKEFVGYERDNITGIELVSIANKIESYQTMKSDDEDYKNMKIIVKNLKSLGNGLFTKDKIDGNDLLSAIDYPKSLESKYGISKIKKLISNKSNIFESTDSSKKVTVEDVLGVEDTSITKETVDKLSDYSEFKTKKFSGKITGYNTKNGKVQELTFTAK